MAKKTEGKAMVYKLNVDDNPQTASAYGVTGIPTIIIFIKGKIEKQLVGVQQETIYLKSLE